MSRIAPRPEDVMFNNSDAELDDRPSGGYENAPATKLLATHCVACGRPLVDAVSVEAGMGPDCRSKFQLAGPENATEEARSDVNKRVAQLARGVPVAEIVGHMLIIRAFGFAKLCDRLEERLCAVRIFDKVDGSPPDVLAVEAPFHEGFTAAVRTFIWRRWDGENKRWLVSGDAGTKKELWKAVRRYFAGGIARLPNGDLMSIEAPR